MDADASRRLETELALTAVGLGLEAALARTGADEVTTKSARDVVTAADLTVEDLIRGALEAELAIPVSGEERGGPTDAARHWIVDPICGTRNYASGVELWCVNLALVEDGEVTVAVVGDGSSGELLVAELGKGTTVISAEGSRPAQASGTSRTVIVEDGKSRGARRADSARFLADLATADRWDLRALGTTLSAAYVATGQVAGYVLFSSSAVHSAAGSLIAAEAGATVSEIGGGRWSVGSDSFLAAADGELHQELLEMVAVTRRPS